MQITEHSWGEGSTIRELEIRKLESGGFEAFLYAPDQAEDTDLSAIPDALAKEGLRALPDKVDERNVLRVTGFKKPRDLIEKLGKAGVVSGEEASKEIQNDKKRGFVETLRKKSVNLSGMTSMIGNATSGISGILEKDMGRVAMCLFYTAATVPYAMHGAGRVKNEFDTFADALRDHLIAEGVEIPKDKQISPEELTKKGGMVEKAIAFVDKYPIEISRALGLLGNASGVKSGLSDGKNGMGRAVNAALSAVAGLAIMLVHERAPSASNPPTSLPGKVKAWIQEKPMRFAGLIYLSGNVAQFKDISQTKRKHAEHLASIRGTVSDEEYGKQEVLAQRTTALAAATAASYFVSSSFTTISSKAKSQDYNDQEMMDKLCAYSVNVLAELPDDLREEAIGKVADYVGKQPGATHSPDQITQLINEKLTQLSDNPWLAKVGDSAKAQPVGGMSR